MPSDDSGVDGCAAGEQPVSVVARRSPARLAVVGPRRGRGCGRQDVEQTVVLSGRLLSSWVGRAWCRPPVSLNGTRSRTAAPMAAARCLRRRNVVGPGAELRPLRAVGGQDCQVRSGASAMASSTYVGTVKARASSRLPTASAISPSGGTRSSTCCTLIHASCSRASRAATSPSRPVSPMMATSRMSSGIGQGPQGLDCRCRNKQGARRLPAGLSQTVRSTGDCVSESGACQAGRRQRRR